MDIATRLGRSKGSLYGKARRLGLRRPPRGKRPNAVAALGEATSGTADNPTGVNGQSALANELPPAPARGSIPCPGENKPRFYIRTRVGGRLSVWFAEVTERMMRLWLANVDYQVIGDVLGPQPDGRKITASAVQGRAGRVGLPPRFGIPLIREQEAAREIDRQAAPLPKSIRHQREPWDLRICPLTGTPFYAPNKNRLSKQAKMTKYYRNYSGIEDGMALAF